MPSPGEVSPGRLELSAFQINDMALYTITAGARKLVSGLTHLAWLNPKQVQIDGGLLFEVDTIVDDPAIVGKFKNQTRLHISGHLDVSSEDLDALLAQWLVLEARERPEAR